MGKEEKTGLIKQYAVNEKDTGSTEVQVAIITERINNLTAHMAAHGKDFSSQRGLLKLVGQRRRLLTYLSRADIDRYHKLIGALGLRK
ncbi:MAG: 30S ribosomal protein S15 [Chloroflexota bacterium]